MPRKVVVATASLRRSGRPHTVEGNLRAAERLLERASAVRPDVVCLPETFAALDVPADSAADLAEPVPGPITARLGAAARRHGTYIVCPVYERDGDRVFNAAVLLDRRGDVAGVYRKIHPTLGELERDVTPGGRVAVFETDFGRVAALICFDVMFPARWQEAKRLGAEVIFWPSAYEGGLPLAARACDNEVYVVASTPVWHSVILDVTGHPLAETGQRLEIASAEIDLEKRVFSTDYNMAQYHAVLAKYGRRVAIDVLSPEGAFTLESRDAAVTVAEIAREFRLEPQADYFRRSALAQERARAVGAPAPGTPEAARAADRAAG
jgi:predicted amidohydrolase